MAKFTTTDNVGVKEDVADYITNLTPSKTPMVTAIGTESTGNTFFQWQEDALRNSRKNAAKEGADATATPRNPTQMRNNGCQIFQDTFSITETQDSIKNYGRGKETAYQVIKTGKELKLDLERAYVSDQVFVQRVGEDVAGETAGALAQIAAANKVSAATGGELTDDLIFDVSERVAFNGGVDANILMVRFADMKIVRRLGAIAETRREVGTEAAKKVVDTIDFYVTPFHELKVVRNIEMNSFNHALVLDPTMWKDVILNGRNWQTRELAKTGDATKTQMITERGLKHKNYLSSGAITDLADAELGLPGIPPAPVTP